VDAPFRHPLLTIRLTYFATPISFKYFRTPGWISSARTAEQQHQQAGAEKGELHFPM